MNHRESLQRIPLRVRILTAMLLAAPLCMVTPVSGEPITLKRVEALPPAEQAAWQTYLQRSATLADKDAATLDAEVAAAARSEARRAPSGGDFKLPADAGDSWYESDEASQLADVILSYQTPSGGWSKHTGYSDGPRQPGMQWTSQNEPGHSPHYVATFDNRSTTEQLHFLANMWLATRREDCRDGFLQGLDYILAAQYPNGGWPQVYPLEGDYHDDITFNDDAMTHVLELLQAIISKAPQFAFVDEEKRSEAETAFAAGIDCVLQIQVEADGRPTGWCAQYDALTLRPSQARALEPPAISGSESAQLLKFLMKIPRPNAELVASIEAGLRWLEEAKITGLQRGKRDGKTAYVSAPDSTEVYWARFYDLESGRPMFPGRDGVVYQSFAEMSENNALGYDYYSSRPGSVLRNGQKKWRKMLAKQDKP